MSIFLYKDSNIFILTNKMSYNYNAQYIDDQEIMEVNTNNMGITNMKQINKITTYDLNMLASDLTIQSLVDQILKITSIILTIDIDNTVASQRKIYEWGLFEYISYNSQDSELPMIYIVKTINLAVKKRNKENSNKFTSIVLTSRNPNTRYTGHTAEELKLIDEIGLKELIKSKTNSSDRLGISEESREGIILGNKISFKQSIAFFKNTRPQQLRLIKLQKIEKLHRYYDSINKKTHKVCTVVSIDDDAAKLKIEKDSNTPSTIFIEPTEINARLLLNNQNHSKFTEQIKWETIKILGDIYNEIKNYQEEAT